MKQFPILFLILFFSMQGYSQSAENDSLQSSDPAWDAFVQLDQEPVPLNMSEFQDSVGYPEEAKQAEITGKVIVRVFISSEGEMLDYIVLRNPHPLLTDAITSKLHLLKWSPGYYQGKPVKVWVTIPVDFEVKRGGLNTKKKRK